MSRPRHARGVVMDVRCQIATASGLTVPDRGGPARPPDPSLLLAKLGQTNPSLLSTLSQGLGHPAGPQSLTFMDRASPAHNPYLSLLLARHLTSIRQSPHFYWPEPGPIMFLGRATRHFRESTKASSGFLTPGCHAHGGGIGIRQVRPSPNRG